MVFNMLQAMRKQIQTPRCRNIGLGLLAILLLIGLLGAVLAPWLLRPWLEERLSAELQRKVSIAELSINPYLLKVEARDIRVLDRDGGAFVAAGKVLVDAQLSSLWYQAPVVRELTVEQLQLRIVRTAPGRFNFSDLLERKSSDNVQRDAALPEFSLNNIRLLDAAIRLEDKVEGSSHALTAFNVSLPFISTLPYRLDEYVTPAISGKLDGSSFALQGKSKPFAEGRETELALDLAALALPRYLEYVPLPEGLSLVSGSLSGRAQFIFRESEPPRFLVRGSAEVSQFRLEWQKQPLLNFAKLDLVAKDIEPFQQRYMFDRVHLADWQLALQRNADGRFAWLAALPASGGSAPDASTASKPQAAGTGKDVSPLIELDQLALSKGKVIWQDFAVKPATAMELRDIQLDVRQLSTAAGKSAKVSLQASGSVLDKLTVAGEISPGSQDGSIKLALEGGQLPAFNAYLAQFSPAIIREGTLAAGARVEFRQGMPVRIDELVTTLSGARFYLAGGREPLLDSGVLALSDSTIDLQKHEILLGKLAGEKGSMTLQINKEGNLNLLGLLPAVKSQSGGQEWRLALADANLQGWTANLEDQRLVKVPPLTLRDISLAVQGLDLASGKPARVSFNAKGTRRGSYKVSGDMIPSPFAGKLQLDLANIDLAYGQPYFTRWLNISLASGFVSAKGELQVASSPGFTGRYTGSVLVSDFYALDKLSGDDFLKWKSFQLSGVNLQFAPLAVKVAEVGINDFYSRLILSPDGRMNLQDILVRDGQATSVTAAQDPVKPDAASASARASAAPVVLAEKGKATVQVPVSIGRLVFKRGNINYSDLFIKPNYTANLTDMNGLITSLSTDPAIRASLELNGSMDKVAPVHISGSLNPLAKDIFIDIKGGVKGYDLTAASTYSAKYAGYGIEKGKLSMDVSYFIENGKLKASNQVFLDQLTLGEQVDSPDATKLPVKFALSLLTDRRGQIKLNIPVEGSLDDPQFSAGGLVWQIIGNLLEKVITSPFDALASAFGDGPQLSHVEFEPGQSKLDANAQQSIQRLAGVLLDRPALKLDIAGWASQEDDAAGLKQAHLQEKIRAMKVAELGDQAESQETTELIISPDDYARLLAQVYKAGKFSKPKNLIGMTKSQPVTEMEKLILANTVIRDEDLRELAMQRAQKTKAALQAAGVEDARLFVVKSRIDVTAADAKDGRLSRAQFTLQ